jgi:hypothetical protein
LIDKSDQVFLFDEAVSLPRLVLSVDDSIIKWSLALRRTSSKSLKFYFDLGFLNMVTAGSSSNTKTI